MQELNDSMAVYVIQMYIVESDMIVFQTNRVVTVKVFY